MTVVVHDGQRLFCQDNDLRQRSRSCPHHSHSGDANGDAVFDSSDFVQVFQAGEYEDDIDGNSTFREGDWNGDGDFDTTDFVLAFQTGRYEMESVHPVRSGNLHKMAAAVDCLFSQGDRKARRPAWVA